LGDVCDPATAPGGPEGMGITWSAHLLWGFLRPFRWRLRRLCGDHAGPGELNSGRPWLGCPRDLTAPVRAARARRLPGLACGGRFAVVTAGQGGCLKPYRTGKTQAEATRSGVRKGSVFTRSRKAVRTHVKRRRQQGYNSSFRWESDPDFDHRYGAKCERCSSSEVMLSRAFRVSRWGNVRFRRLGPS
jgi:hypothetical protein